MTHPLKIEIRVGNIEIFVVESENIVSEESEEVVNSPWIEDVGTEVEVSVFIKPFVGVDFLPMDLLDLFRIRHAIMVRESHLYRSASSDRVRFLSI